MRLADSRNNAGSAGTTALQPGETRSILMSGRGGIPTSGVTAVVFDLEIINPTSNTSITVHPSGSARPNTSAVNASTGVAVSNTVVSALGADGRVALYGLGGSAHFTIDLQGYFAAASPASSGGFTPVAGTRLVDTRTGVGSAATMVPAGGSINVRVAGVEPVPAGALAVMANMTATGSTTTGFLTAYATGAPRPATSTVNYTASGPVAGAFAAQPNSSGYLTIYNGGATPVHVIVDVSGYFESGTAGGAFTPQQQRLFDSRTVAVVGPNDQIDLLLAGVGGVPSVSVGASVLANVQAVTPSADGYVRIWPGGQEEPLTSSLNYQIGGVRSNLSTLTTEGSGYVSIKNVSAGNVTIVVDMQGWWASDPRDGEAIADEEPPPPTSDTANYYLRAASGGQFSPAGCEGFADTPHMSRTVNYTERVNFHFRAVCKYPVKVMYLRAQLWQHRWWGWDRIGKVGQKHFVNVHRKWVVGNEVCEEGQTYYGSGYGYTAEAGERYVVRVSSKTWDSNRCP